MVTDAKFGYSWLQLERLCDACPLKDEAPEYERDIIRAHQTNCSVINHFIGQIKSNKVTYQIAQDKYASLMSIAGIVKQLLVHLPVLS